jgi:hypothetical protein
LFSHDPAHVGCSAELQHAWRLSDSLGDKGPPLPRQLSRFVDTLPDTLLIPQLRLNIL